MLVDRQTMRPQFLISFLLVLIAVVVTRPIHVEAAAMSNDPKDPCSTHALNAYQKCVGENACVCQNCGDPNDPDWVITAPEPKSCFDLSQIFCPLVKCCSPCEHVLSFYHNCLAKRIADIYLGPNNCTLFLCPIESNDVVCSPSDDQTNEGKNRLLGNTPKSQNIRRTGVTSH